MSWFRTRASPETKVAVLGSSLMRRLRARRWRLPTWQCQRAAARANPNHTTVRSGRLYGRSWNSLLMT